ncbi:hypothetical protein ILUMI_00025 [Ignelater luminosus]|uniref:EF-hand domain-containing protein n=1 Tax=Ignelater luminosus TaxID=2038154 RepID=A0A8K0DMF0_IGNLU|nr:hypothetical protein ILUMI_00025 [Ignelater luminosus]
MVNRRRRGSSGKFFSFTEALKKSSKGAVGVPLDTTLDEKEEKRFRKKFSGLSKRLSKELPLTFEEVESLMVIYYKFQKTGEHVQQGMTKVQVKELLHSGFDSTSNEIIDDVCYVLDRSPSPYITMENWVKAIALFLRGTFEERIQHCFNVYDVFSTGRISREKMLQLMNNSVIGEEDTEDVVKDLVDVITKKLDVNRDGQITYDDFHQAVTNQPLMLECLGQCFPTRIATTSFLISFTPYIGKL